MHTTVPTERLARTCCHESGHAFAARLHGIGVTKLSVIETGGDSNGVTQLNPAGLEAAGYAALIVAAAGGQAEYQLGPQCAKELFSDSDLAFCHSVLDAMGKPRHEHSSWISAAKDDAARLVYKYGPAISKLAERLAAVGQMNGNQLDAFLSELFPGGLPAAA